VLHALNEEIGDSGPRGFRNRDKAGHQERRRQRSRRRRRKFGLQYRDACDEGLFDKQQDKKPVPKRRERILRQGCETTPQRPKIHIQKKEDRKRGLTVGGWRGWI
jgi:hypothetical protein